MKPPTPLVLLLSMTTSFMSLVFSQCLASSSSSLSRCRSIRPSCQFTSSRIHCSQSNTEAWRPAAPLKSGVCEDLLDVKHVKNLLQVKSVLTKIGDPLESMMTIDSLQRLGIDYHFREDIKSTLGSICNSFRGDEDDHIDGLFEVSLFFRLLRQAGYFISSDVFKKFIDKKGRFESSLKTDVKGLLSLYEASQLNTGEDILYKANEFTGKCLTSSVEQLEPNVARLVRQTLKHPYHMTLPRYSARCYLSHCQSSFGQTGVLEQLARLDFNLVQSLHQSEFNDVLRWWESTGLAQELSFARDQLLKWYLWPMTTIPDPQFSKCRTEITKVIAFIYIIDDIFDVYGSLEEASLFTEAINRWDLSAVEGLPCYMRVCYVTLYNITNGIAQEVLKRQGWNPINYLKRTWTTLCDAFLLESKWFRSKHVPKADEYLRNGVISSGSYVAMVHLYFLLGQGITKKNANFLESKSALVSCPATILRLRDDLGSAKDENQEGFDGSYIEFFMKEHPNCSPQSARNHVMNMMSNSWQNLNKECFSQSSFSQHFVAASLNSARMVEVMYSYDEEQNQPILKDYVNMLLFQRA